MIVNLARPQRPFLVALSLATVALIIDPVPGMTQPPSPTGRMVDIGGVSLHLDCRGSGSPTVILEAGAGAFSFVWALVQPGVARVTRVCSYDRAGFAWSDPGRRPRSAAQLALELHLLLERAGEVGPYLVVGHSFGGVLVRSFAERYRNEVAGMVLVDAAHEDQRIRMGNRLHLLRSEATGPEPAPPVAGLDTAWMRLRRVGAVSTRPEAPIPEPLDRLPASAQSLWRWAARDSVFLLAYGAEMEASGNELHRMHDARLADRAVFRAIPLIVLSRNYPDGDSLSIERRAQQRDLARLSARGELRVAVGSDHNIQIEDPAFVIAAIRDAIEAVRRK